MKIVLLNDLLVNKEFYKNVERDLKKLGHDFIYYLDKPKNDEEIIERIKDCDILIDDNTPLSVEVLKEAKNLKYIDVAFTGVDHIPLKYCHDKKIVVSNCSGYATEAVAELILCCILTLARDLKRLDSEMREDKANINFLGSELSERVVGIIGTGKIGGRLIELLRAFNLRILAYSRTIKKSIVQKGVTYVDLNDLLKNSDYVCLTLSLDDSSFHLIGEKELKLMKKTACIINTARGPIIDETALINALKNNTIRGAALDVFNVEPPLDDNNELLKLNNVLLSPHIGYRTNEAMKKRAEIALSNLYSFLEKKTKNRIIWLQ